MEVKRFDVFLISLDPTRGREMRKTRPCLIISPDEMNDNISTVIVAPTSRSAQEASFRPIIEVDGEPTKVLVEQVVAANRDHWAHAC